jgi:iron complex outermembrane recepter protein
LALGAGQPASADPAADAQADDQLAAVVVTASRIERPGFTSATPVTTVSATDIAASGVSNIADLLNEVPSIRPTITSTSADARPTFPGANFLDLRGLGPDRTLVLVNGERLVPQVGSFSSSPDSHANDMNVLPTIAIQSVDVVTGGASSAWGSDALAGVVNLQLYKRYDGLKLDASAGASQYGDNANQSVELLGGRSFFDDRAHAVVAVAFNHDSGVGDMFTRSWGKDAPYILSNPACNHCYLAGTGYQYATYAPGGLITNTALQGTAFAANGQPYAFPYGRYVSGSGEFGGSVPGNYPQANVEIEAPIARGSFYGYFDYKLTDKLTANVSINAAVDHVSINNQVPEKSYTILSGNPYIPAPIQAAMTANQIASFNLGENYTNLGVPVETSDTRLFSISAGFRWDIGYSWVADLHYSHGINNVDQQYPNQFNLVNAAQAANAVAGPNGSIVCANPANGCVPFNVFGQGGMSPASLAFILQNSFTDIHYVMNDVAFDFRGEPVILWAGPVSIAAGGEYRTESQRNSDDAGQNEQVFFGVDNVDFSGSENVTEAYIESVVPLAKDLPFVKELDFNGAYREAKYSVLSEAAADTWKLGITWNLTNDFFLRGTYSRDFRAPDLTELYFPKTVTSVTTVVPGQSELASFTQGGNTRLLPEIAYNAVVGFTYRPHFVAGLSASVDTYRIDLSNVITSASATNILSSCTAGAAISCNQITKVKGVVTAIEGGFTNLSAITDRGTDIELDYTASLAKLDLPGSVIFRALGSFTSTLAYQAAPGYPIVNYAGQNEVGVAVRSQYYAPRFKGSLGVGYHLNQFLGTLVANVQSASVADATLTTAQYPSNDIPAYVDWDLRLSYRCGDNKQFQVYGTVNNLLNAAPPFTPVTVLFIPVNSAAYDTIGRTFLIGLRWSH